MANFREHSKDNWNSVSTVEHINAGSLQRIADATEKMAGNYIKLQSDYDYMRKSRDNYRECYESSLRKISALKGVITKLKRKF